MDNDTAINGVVIGKDVNALNQNRDFSALQNNTNKLKGVHLSTVRTNTSQAIIEYLQDHSRYIRKVAYSFGIMARDLRLRLLLYMPRLIQDSTFPNKQTFMAECQRIAEYMSSLVQPYHHWSESPSKPLESPREAQFTTVPEEEARIIHERFHYLASFRKDSIHLGLKAYTDGRLIALITISPFDLTQTLEKLPKEIVKTQVMVLSRVFAFDWAPKNTISHLLRHTNNWIMREVPEIKMLITYVNPNLGFTGASYRASNWVLFGREWGTRYVYLDGFYITERELIRRFGSADVLDLHDRLGSRLEYTSVELEPLLLFAYFLDRYFRMQHQIGFNFDFRRSP